MPKLTNEITRFLERLRESGEINMMGAAPYLQEAFNLDKKTARGLLIEWMKKE